MDVNRKLPTTPRGGRHFFKGVIVIVIVIVINTIADNTHVTGGAARS